MTDRPRAQTDSEPSSSLSEPRLAPRFPQGLNGRHRSGKCIGSRGDPGRANGPCSGQQHDQGRPGVVAAGAVRERPARPVNADSGVKLVAMADAFADRLEESLSELKSAANASRVDVPKDRQFYRL